jgi:hypothetical protein
MCKSNDADHDVCTISELVEHIECNKENSIQNIKNTNHLRNTMLIGEPEPFVKCSISEEQEKTLRDIQANNSLTSKAAESPNEHSNESIRILLCGDVLGRLNHLKEAIESSNNKQGPFHFVLCCGSFFSNSDSENVKTRLFSFKNTNHQVLVTEEEYNFLTGEEKFSLCIYFIDSSMSQIGDVLRSGNHANYSFSPTLTYLGNYGVTKLHGLTVAYLSGLYNVAYFFQDAKDDEYNNEKKTFDQKISLNSTKINISNLSVQFETSLCDTKPLETHFVGYYSAYYNRAGLEQFQKLCYQNAGNCDIFLSCEWPSGVDQNLSNEKQQELQQFIHLGETQPGLCNSTYVFF